MENRPNPPPNPFCTRIVLNSLEKCFHLTKYSHVGLECETIASLDVGVKVVLKWDEYSDMDRQKELQKIADLDGEFNPQQWANRDSAMRRVLWVANKTLQMTRDELLSTVVQGLGVAVEKDQESLIAEGATLKEAKCVVKHVTTSREEFQIIVQLMNSLLTNLQKDYQPTSIPTVGMLQLHSNSALLIQKRLEKVEAAELQFALHAFCDSKMEADTDAPEDQEILDVFKFPSL